MKRRFKPAKALSAILALLLVLTMLPMNVLAGTFANTTEAETEALTQEAEALNEETSVTPLSTPIEIGNAGQLMSFLQGGMGPNNGHFVMTANISMIGTYTSGRGYVGGMPFTGTFDGGGFEITGLRFRPRQGGEVTENPNHDNSVGFIRVAGNGAVIRNLTLRAGPDATAATATYFDNLAAWNLVANPSAAGMFLGRATSGTVTMQNVHLAGNMFMWVESTHTTAARRLGAFVGRVEAGAILNMTGISSQSVNIILPFGRTYGVGGVIGSSAGNVTINGGQLPDGTPVRNHVVIDIRGRTATSADHIANHAGGVVGRVEGGAFTINDTNVNVGPLVPPPAAGGVRQIRGRMTAGGFVGWTTGSGNLTVRNATNGTQLVAAFMNDARAGGIAGHTQNTVNMQNVENIGSLEMPQRNRASIGGIIGQAAGSTVIDGARNSGEIRGHSSRTIASHACGLGGIVGRISSGATIRDAHNSGTVRRINANQNSSPFGLGGIVGQIQPLGTGVRTVRIENVTNVGTIGNLTGTTIPQRNVGGIVGLISSSGNQTVIIDGATNEGTVRARRRAGGIVGGNTDSNVQITRSMNYGLVEGTDAARFIGGILGHCTGANMRINQSGNAGVVRGVGTGTNTSAGRGVGGIVGRNSATLTITESFNSGFVIANMMRVGGILGANVNGNVEMRNIYSVGTVHSRYTGGGSGIVGMRQSGTIVIENAFVSGHFFGYAVGNASTATGTSAANLRNRGNLVGFRLSNVYVDTSTRNHLHRNDGPQTAHFRLQTNQGVMAVNTDILTAGLLRGISPGPNSPWLTGVRGIHPDEQRTYPYFAWQTDGEQQERFFRDITMPPFISQINPGPGYYARAMDMAQGSGSRNVIFTNIDYRYTGNLNTGVRIFHPYRVTRPPIPSGTGAAATISDVANVAGTGGQMFTNGALRSHIPVVGPAGGGVIPSLQQASTRTGNYPVTMGLISENDVVTFSTGDREDWVYVTAIDAYCGTPIGHVMFEHNIPAGHTVLNMQGLLITVAAAPDVGTRIDATAVGYAPASFTFSNADILELLNPDGNRQFEIPMTRVAIPVRVFLHDDLTETEDDLGRLLTPADTAAVVHSIPWTGGQPPHTALGNVPQATAAPHLHAFRMAHVYIGDLLETSARGWYPQDFNIAVGDFERNDYGQIVPMDGYYTIRVTLRNLRLPMPAPIDVFRDIERPVPGGEDGEYELTPFMIGALTNPDLVLRLECPVFGTSITATNQGVLVRANNRFTIPASTDALEISVLSRVWVEANNPVGGYSYLSNEPFVLDDMLDVYEPEEGLPSFYPIEVVMRRVVAHHIEVREALEFEWCDTADDYIVTSYVRIRSAVLRFYDNLEPGEEYRIVTHMPNNPGRFEVDVANGCIFSPLASGFVFPDGQYIVEGPYENYLIIIYMDREDPEPDEIRGFVYSSAEGNEPIENAAVSIRNATGQVVGTATTDASGFYSVRGLPVGQYWVFASATGFAPNASHNNPVTISTGAGAWADVELTPDPTGENQYLLHVAVVGTAPNTPIDVFMNTTRMPPAPGVNVWSLTGNAAMVGTARAIALNYNPAERQVVAGDYTDRIAFVVLTLERIIHVGNTGGIDGFVTGANDTPIEGATIFIIGPAGSLDSTTRRVTTNQIGYYRQLNLEPGSYQVIATAPGRATMTATAVVLAGSMTRVNFTGMAEQAGNYIVIATVTGGSLNEVSITTAGATFNRVRDNDDNYTNVWEARTNAPLPAAQPVNASAGRGHEPQSREVGQYENGVAKVAFEFAGRRLPGPGEHEVIFYRNDGTPTIHYIAIVDTGRTVDPPANPVRTGYTFLGWYTEATTENRFNFGTLITTDNTELYARWRVGQGVTHTARFWRNDGSGNLHYVAFVPHGEQLTEPSLPIRAGFTFEYWSRTALDFIRTSTPFEFPYDITGDLVLHARWRIGGVPGTHTVVFRRNDGTNAIHHVEIVDHGRTVTPPANPTRDGYTFMGWERENTGVLFDFGTLITEHIVLNARWREGDGVTHTVLFWRNDGSGNLHFASFVPDGEQVTAPRNPVRVDYDFVHWSTSATTPAPIFNLPATVTSNITLHATWTPGEGGGHMVVFYRNDGTNIVHHWVRVNHGRTVNPPANPIRAGHTFLGWYTDPANENRFNFGTLITDDLNLYASWQVDGPEETHIARFWRNDDSDNLHYVAFVVDGDQLTEPEEPTRGGFTFAYWSRTASDFLRMGPFEFPYAISDDLDLHARWQLGSGDTLTVVFRMNDSTTRVHHVAIVDYGRTVTPPVNPIRAGHTFLGWDREDNGEAFNFGTLITDNLVLNARWRVGGPELTHTVLFWRNDNAGNLHYAAFVPDGEQLTAPANPMRAGFRFIHWSLAMEGADEEFELPMTPTTNLTLYAQWRPVSGDITIDVDVDEDGNVTIEVNPPDTNYEVDTDDDGNIVITLPDAEDDDDIEVNLPPGWEYERGKDDDGNTIIVITPPTGYHFVVFRMNDGTSAIHRIILVANNRTVVPPENPRRDGYRFLGWYTEPATTTLFSFGTLITSNLTLYAGWEEGDGETYQVRFWRNDNSGLLHEVFFVAEGARVTPPPIPTRTNYTFTSWHTNSAGTALFNFTTAIIADIDLYADWLEDYEHDDFHQRFMIGYPDGTFRPQAQVTRAEVTAMLVRTLLDVDDVPTPSITGVFRDVNQASWFHRYIALAYENEIIFGYPDGTFRPNNPITREEFVAIVARTETNRANRAELAVLTFTDADETSEWAVEYVQIAYREGWIFGDTAGTFRPLASLSRVEAAAVVARVLGRGDTTEESIADVIDDVRLFPDVTNVNAWYYFYVIEVTNSHRFTIVDGLEIWTSVEPHEQVQDDDDQDD